MDRSARHGPNRLEDYVQIHETVIRRLIDRGTIEHNGLQILPDGAGGFVMTGGVVVRGGLVKVEVSKRLETVDASDEDDPRVQTAKYRYNVSIVGHGCVFRYCSPHAEDGQDDGFRHHHQHHRHQYDPFGPDPGKYDVKLIENGDWPSLQEVIEEAERWYLNNLDRVKELTTPDSPENPAGSAL